MKMTHRKDRDKWEVDFGMVSGRRARKLFATRKEAEEALREARRMRAQHGSAALAIPAHEMAELLAAKARAEAAGVSVGVAVDFYLQRAGVIRERLSLTAALDRYLLSKQAEGVRETYLARLEVTLGNFISSRTHLAMTDIGPHEVRAWFSGNQWAPRTIRGVLEDIRTWWRWAMANGLAAEDPTAGIVTRMEEAKEVETLSVAECAELLRLCVEECDDVTGRPFRELLGFVTLSMFCGIRRAELLRMDASGVDVEQSLVIIEGRHAKTRQRRTVTLAPNALEWWRWWRADSAALICRNWHDLWARMAHRVRRPWPKNALRHTFASMHYAAHKNEMLTQAEMGHASSAMLFAHYRGLVRPSEAEAFWALRPPDRRG